MPWKALVNGTLLLSRPKITLAGHVLFRRGPSDHEQAESHVATAYWLARMIEAESPQHRPRSGSGRPTTLSDVAAHAGVSAATVSRVLAGNYPVSRSARQRVQRAIRELN